MNRGAIIGGFWAGALAALLAVPALSRSSAPNPNQPPPHTLPYPDLGSGESLPERRKSYELAPELQRGVSAAQIRDQQRRLDSALAALAPQTPATPDAFVVTIALDSDPVFAREAREAARVLSARYGAGGRTLTLAGPDGTRDDAPHGSITALVLALSHIGSLMAPSEDVLVLYTTSHGLDLGLALAAGAAETPVANPGPTWGAADVQPTPENPVYFRHTFGHYPGATPPLEWWEGTPTTKKVTGTFFNPPRRGETDLLDFADTKSKNILWKVPVPGWSLSHPIVVGKKVFAVGEPDFVTCWDLDTGKQLWQRRIMP